MYIGWIHNDSYLNHHFADNGVRAALDMKRRGILGVDKDA